MKDNQLIAEWLLNNKPTVDPIEDEDLINTRDTIHTDFNGHIIGRIRTVKVRERQMKALIQKTDTKNI